MSDFSEEETTIVSEPTSVINAVDIKLDGKQLILTDKNGEITTLTLSDEALNQLPEVLPSETAGGSRRRKSRKHKVKRRNKSQRRHRRR